MRYGRRRQNVMLEAGVTFRAACLSAPAAQLNAGSECGVSDATKPLVSVLIPAYNEGPLLRQAIESVLAQTYRRFEVIVVNDGSTSPVTRDTTRGYGDRITYVEQSNMGVAGARQTALEASSGELVAFLDQDDRWLPESWRSRSVRCPSTRGLFSRTRAATRSTRPARTPGVPMSTRASGRRCRTSSSRSRPLSRASSVATTPSRQTRCSC